MQSFKKNNFPMQYLREKITKHSIYSRQFKLLNKILSYCREMTVFRKHKLMPLIIVTKLIFYKSKFLYHFFFFRKLIGLEILGRRELRRSQHNQISEVNPRQK